MTMRFSGKTSFSEKTSFSRRTSFGKPVSLFARMLTIVAMLLALTPAPAHAATIIYVVPNGTGDGSSWLKGKDLADALADAGSGTQLYIQTGVYTPKVTDASHPENATFTINDGVELYGGFTGNESAIPTECTSPATLSGAVEINEVTYNSRHVVTIGGVSDATRLNCLIIQNGYASDNGGGIYNAGGSPKLTDVTIQANSAIMSGGGMYNSGGSPTLNRVIFTNNRAIQGFGGGMHNYGSSPTLTNVTFQNNTADSGGGGIYNNNYSTLTLDHAIFTGNTSSNDYGGGIFNAYSSLALTDVTFDSNICNGNSDYHTDLPGKGGGLAISVSSNVTLNRVSFNNNIARGSGGGMYSSESNPELTGVTFEDNSALSGAASLGPSTRTYGGGMHSENGNPILRDVTFRNNLSSSQNYESYGGGLSIKNDSGGSKLINVIFIGNAANNGAGLANVNSDPTLTNVTISGNANYGNCTKASNGFNDINCGAGIYNFLGSSPSLHNSIVWGNHYDQIFNSLQDGGISASTTYINNSIVQGSNGSGVNWLSSAGTDRGNNLDADPAFVTSVPIPNAEKTGDVRLKAGSPAMNNGDNELLPSYVNTDLSGNPRKVGIVDMGAYEYQDTTRLPPQTSIDLYPDSLSNNKTPSFSFSSDHPGSTFRCVLDGGEPATCTSPTGYTNLADGAHSFQVQAKDSNDYVDWTPASYTWSVDTRVETFIDASSKPANPSNSASASFSFGCGETGCSFECYLGTGTWGPCTSPQTYSELSEGEYTFGVRATDSAGNKDLIPDSYTWTVDTTPPDTTLNSRPDDPAASQSATFAFSSSEANSTFQCTLDGGAPAPCTSPKTYNHLADGAHTFEVQATDRAGNPDPSPARAAWTVTLRFWDYLPLIMKY